MCSQIHAKFQQRDQLTAQGAELPMVIDLDDEPKKQFSHPRRRKQPLGFALALQEYSPQTQRRKRLRQCHQSCKPLSGPEAEIVLANGSLAAAAIAERDLYIDLLKQELAQAEGVQDQDQRGFQVSCCCILLIGSF